MLSAASFRAFAKGDRKTELNQTLRHVRKWARFANGLEQFKRFSIAKIGKLETGNGDGFQLHKTTSNAENRTGVLTHQIPPNIYGALVATVELRCLRNFHPPNTRCQQNKVAPRNECEWNNIKSLVCRGSKKISSWEWPGVGQPHK